MAKGGPSGYIYRLNTESEKWPREVPLQHTYNQRTEGSSKVGITHILVITSNNEIGLILWQLMAYCFIHLDGKAETSQ